MRSKRRKLDREVRGGLLGLQLCLQDLELRTRLCQARLEEMLKERERKFYWLNNSQKAGTAMRHPIPPSLRWVVFCTQSTFQLTHLPN